ncbi:hypothetical protein CIAN88_14615 [[Clostridium] innocuum]|uniref:DUF3846 domain-containing protein n=1 Tax=Clostridium innocuum TaxID=1522 RepID=A0A099I481_CLOIN|nr:DUF3846 domain-containing protein [[Clostridium] innocuum]KGJ52480.1 hypothetical protein CIAN88_14615 [[Clostridium] innocuum]
MKEYEVKITETLEKTVTVQAASRAEAEEKVEEAWNNSEYILDSENFVGAKFTTESERALENSLIDVLLVEPGQYPKQIKIGSDLDDLREAVDGDIECTYPFEDEVGIILNECGKLLGLPLNRAMRTDDGEVYDIYAGSFLVVGLTEDNFGSLSPELMEKFEAKFHQPEMFVKLGKGMMVLPIPEESMKARDQNKGIEPKIKKSPEVGDM